MGRGKLGEGFWLAPEFWHPRDDLELTELSIFRGSHRFPTLQEPKNDLVSCPTSGSYMVLVSIEVHSSFPGLSEQPRENRPTCRARKIHLRLRASRTLTIIEDV